MTMWVGTIVRVIQLRGRASGRRGGIKGQGLTGVVSCATCLEEGSGFTPISRRRTTPSESLREFKRAGEDLTWMLTVLAERFYF